MLPEDMHLSGDSSPSPSAWCSNSKQGEKYFLGIKGLVL